MLSRHSLAQLRTAGNVVRQVTENIPRVTNASGTPMQIDGAFLCRFWLAGARTSAVFLASPDLTVSAIIGCNIIREELLIFDPADNVVKRRHQICAAQVWESAPVTLVNSLTVEPGQSRLARLKVSEAQSSRPLADQDVLVTLGGPIMATFAVHTDINGCFSLYIPNASVTQLTLDRRSQVGTAEPLGAWTMESASSVSAAAVLAAMNAKEQAKPASGSIQQVRRDILDSVARTVPAPFRHDYVSLLFEFIDCFSTGPTDLGFNQDVEVKVNLKDQTPVYRSQFRIPEAHMELIKSSVAAWQDIGIIQPANSPYNSPIFCVPKKEGKGLRVVLDYRAINAHSLPDRYSIKTVEECIADIGRAGSTVFASLDQRSGFWQQKLHEDSRPATAFTIPGVGQYQYVTCPMGLAGSPAAFSRLMDLTMEGLSNTITYIDDTLVHAPDHPSLLHHLRDTLLRFRKANLKLNAEKCIFGSTEVQYLGHTLTSKGVRPGLSKTQAIADSVSPTTMRQVKSFIGLCNYFRGYIRDFATLCAPLNRLTRNDSGWKSGPLPDDAERAFQTLKQCLTEHPILQYPTPEGKFHLYVDAALGDANNAGGLGAVLMQEQERYSGNKAVIGFASRQLQKHEQNYPAGLLEQAACVFGMSFFEHYLRGRPFALYTDHRPVENLSRVHSKTLQNLHLKMLELQPEIRYIEGKYNGVADYLSRYHGLGCAMIDTGVFRLRTLQAADPEITKIAEAVAPLLKTAPPETPVRTPLCRYPVFIQDGVIMVHMPPVKGTYSRTPWRVFAPDSMRKEIMTEAHNSRIAGHSGSFRTIGRIREQFWWPGMDADVAEHVKRCTVCQACTNKNDNEPIPPLAPLPQPGGPNERVHIDLWGPAKTKEGNKMVLVITDAFTKIVRLTAIPNKSAATVARAILDSWIFIYGVPKTIITDGGPEFCNQLNRAIWDSLGIDHSRTTPFHPQTNANAEVFNKTMAHYLTTAVHQAQSSQLDWELLLGPLMLSFNTAVHKSTRNTPFYTMFGYDPRMPLWNDADIIRFDQQVSHPDQAQALLQLRRSQALARQAAHNSNQHARQEYTQQYNKHNNTAYPSYAPGDNIWLRYHDVNEPNRKLSAKWEPAVIEEATDNPAVFRVVRLNRKRKPRISINVQQMKPRLDPDRPADPNPISTPHADPGLDPSRAAQNTSPPVELQPEELSLHPPHPSSRSPSPNASHSRTSYEPPLTRAQAKKQQQQLLNNVSSLFEQQVRAYINAVHYEWLYEELTPESMQDAVLSGKGALLKGGGPPPHPPNAAHVAPARPSYASTSSQEWLSCSSDDGDDVGFDDTFLPHEDHLVTPPHIPPPLADKPPSSKKRTPLMLSRLKDTLKKSFRKNSPPAGRASTRSATRATNPTWEGEVSWDPPLDTQNAQISVLSSPSPRLSSRTRPQTWPTAYHIHHTSPCQGYPEIGLSRGQPAPRPNRPL